MSGALRALTGLRLVLGMLLLYLTHALAPLLDDSIFAERLTLQGFCYTCLISLLSCLHRSNALRNAALLPKAAHDGVQG